MSIKKTNIVVLYIFSIFADEQGFFHRKMATVEAYNGTNDYLGLKAGNGKRDYIKDTVFQKLPKSCIGIVNSDASNLPRNVKYQIVLLEPDIQYASAKFSSHIEGEILGLKEELKFRDKILFVVNREVSK